MTIVFLTREYKHEKLPPSGGTGNYYANLAQQLNKQGHVVAVFGVARKKIDFIDNGVPVRFEQNLFKKNKFYNLIRSISGKFKCLKKLHFAIHEQEKKDIAKQLQLFIKKNNLAVDIIETHDFDGISLFLGNQIPYIIRCHGSFSVFDKYYGFKVEKSKLYCEKEAFKKATNIIVISEYSKKINHELFGKNNMKLIYNGIDTNRFSADQSVAVVPKSIFHFGNTSIEKGAETSLAVFIELQKTMPETTLHFLGIETDYKKELLTTIEQKQLMDKVVFNGFKQTDQAIKILSSADILLFPSKGETFGLALGEAMALGKAVITSNIASFKEVICSSKNGFIAETVTDYVKYIELLFCDEKLKKAVEIEARNTIVTKFSQDKMIAETI